MHDGLLGTDVSRSDFLAGEQILNRMRCKNLFLDVYRKIFFFVVVVEELVPQLEFRGLQVIELSNHLLAVRYERHVHQYYHSTVFKNVA